MGDGRINKYAIILNGSAEKLALQEIRRVGGFFEERGYDMFFASPKDSVFDNATYFEPTSAGIEKLAGRVSSLVDDDDEVVIYGGGHGDKTDGGCLSMKDRCVSKTDPVFTKLFNLPAGERAVIMNMCFSGNWANLFIDDPKTFFVSAGSCGEEVLFDDFDRSFFANEKKIKDADKDGKISWRDRFLHTARQQRGSRGCYVGSRTKSPTDAGDVRQCSRFLPKTYQAKSVGEYEGLLKQLREDDMAVVVVGTPNCRGCKTYLPQFRRMAEAPAQKALFIEIPNGEDNGWNGLRAKLKVEAYPSVFLVDGRGRLLLVDKDKMTKPLSMAKNLQTTAEPKQPPPTQKSEKTDLETNKEKTRLSQYLKDAWNLADGMVDWARENNHWYNRIDESQLLGVLIGYSHLKEIPSNLQGLRDYEGKARQMLRELVSTHTGYEAAKEVGNALVRDCSLTDNDRACDEGYIRYYENSCTLITGETFTRSWSIDGDCRNKPSPPTNSHRDM